MMFPILNTGAAQRFPVKGFYGINRKKKGSVGECVDCCNVDGDEFPVLRSVRIPLLNKTSEDTITKLLAPTEEKFEMMGIIGGEVSGLGKFEKKDNSPVERDVRITDILRVGDAIVTVPQFSVYNTLTKKYTCKPDKGYSKTSSVKDINVIGAYHSNDKCYYTLDKSGLVEADRGKKISHIWIKVNDEVFEWNSLSGEECLVVEYSTRAYVYSYKKNGDVFESAPNDVLKDAASACGGNDRSVEYRILFEEDDIPLACAWQNRVWGVTGDGRQIVCSKLGELNNFTDYDDGAASAWFSEVGSDGKFTGITTYSNAIFAFKENCVHVVYGTIPQNYSLEKTFDACGCIDSKSIIVVNNVLYWLGHNGIYRYSGGTPRVISDNLNKKYKACVSFTDNEKLYLNLTDLEGNREFLSFDTKTGLWHRYENENYIGGFLHDGKLYAYTQNEVYQIRGGDFGEWSFESVIEYNETFENHSSTEIYIRAELEAKSTLTVEYKGISESDWEWCGTYTADERCMIKEKFVARAKCDKAYQWKLSGSGEAYIYEIEKTAAGGGRSFERG